MNYQSRAPGKTFDGAFAEFFAAVLEIFELRSKWNIRSVALLYWIAPCASFLYHIILGKVAAPHFQTGSAGIGFSLALLIINTGIFFVNTREMCKEALEFRVPLSF